MGIVSEGAVRQHQEKVPGITPGGVVRMSPRNLRAIVDLRGVSVPPAAFERLFEEALKKAKTPAGFFADAVD